MDACSWRTKNEDSATGVTSPAVADWQIATPIAVGARGNLRVVSLPAASAAGGSHMDVDPVIEVVYLGESEIPVRPEVFRNTRP